MRMSKPHPLFVHLGKEVLDKNDKVICVAKTKALAEYIANQLNESVKFRKVKRLLAL
jgi:hypothetical protein